MYLKNVKSNKLRPRSACLLPPFLFLKKSLLNGLEKSPLLLKSATDRSSHIIRADAGPVQVPDSEGRGRGRCTRAGGAGTGAGTGAGAGAGQGPSQMGRGRGRCRSRVQIERAGQGPVLGPEGPVLVQGPVPEPEGPVPVQVQGQVPVPEQVPVKGQGSVPGSEGSCVVGVWCLWVWGWGRGRDRCRGRSR